MPYHILLVDDDPYFRSEFREFMGDFDVIEAGRGADAVKILKKPHNIDLIILDENLPQTRGTDLLHEIHAISPDIPVIILTGIDSKDVAIDALRAQATDYIEKPLSKEKISKIRSIVFSAPKGQKYKTKTGVDGKIEQAKHFIERNFQKSLTLTDIADEVNLSPKYLSRIFKEKTGTSFVDYKLKLRIEKAQEWLAGSGDNIEEIAYKLGYQNPESFGKIFRQLTKMTPRDYRNSQKIKQKSRYKSKFVKDAEFKEKAIVPSILTDLNDAVIEYGLDGKITSWSKGAEKLYGWKEKEMVEKTFDDTELDDKISRLIKSTNKIAEKSIEYETRRSAKSGMVLDVWGKLTAERTSRGKIVKLVTIERDITKRKLRQKKMIEETKKLRKQVKRSEEYVKQKRIELASARKQLNQEKHLAGLGRLASIVAHEMRRPINSIQMAAWNIRKKANDPLIENNLLCIEEMVEESEQIISNLLNYSRIKMPVLKRVEIRGLVEKCIASAEKRMKPNRVSLRTMFTSIGKKQVRTDPLQFKQILSNVIMNAYEALPGKKQQKISIRVKINKNHLTVKVTDNGCGISPQDIEHIFDPFFTKKHKGTGLGLSVCREIIALHDGNISIDSVPGRGTTVLLTFPLK